MRRWIFSLLLACLVSAAPACAQQQPDEPQITEAVSPLPEAMQAGAMVLGFSERGTLGTLRKGSNPMICLADDPERLGFHVACYHKALEPFMARGRELRAEGITNPGELNSIRRAEIDSGKLAMPELPAALMSLTGDSLGNARPLHVIYIPYATEETTGIPELPARDRPWLMFPGTALAHVMISLP
jgi:hypothetical protein